MKSTKGQLANAIKTIVEKEVKKQLKEALNEYTLVSKSSVVEATPTQLDAFSLADAVLEKDRQTQQTPTMENKPLFNTKNPVLNEVLNQTHGGVPRDPTQNAMDEYRNLLNTDTFTMADEETILTHGRMPQQASVSSMRGNTGAKIDPNSSTGQAIDAAMNRDYSELVKRFKK